MGSLDMSQNQNGISIRFSSRNKSQIFSFESPPSLLEFLNDPLLVTDYKDLLHNHVVPGNIMSADIQDGVKVANLAQKHLEIRSNEDGKFVGGAKLGKMDSQVLNVVVHELVDVISPEKLQDDDTHFPEQDSDRILFRMGGTLEDRMVRGHMMSAKCRGSPSGQNGEASKKSPKLT